jgi:hypothetical protein
MALYPGARARLIPAGSNDPKIIPIGVVLHVDAGNSGSLWDYFSHDSGGIESHFFIRKDGGVEQYRDTTIEADANYHGNSFKGSDGKTYGFVSVETQGYAQGEWTDQQLAEIKKLLTWMHKTHNVPLRVCPAWNAPGVGWHVMWGAPGPWTNARGKVCPGPDRVKQFNNILVPWFQTGDVAPVNPPAVEDDMPWTEDQLRKMMREENEKYGGRLWGAPTGTGTHLIMAVAALSKAVAAIGNQIASTDKLNDQAFNDAMNGLNANLQALTEAVQKDNPA